MSDFNYQPAYGAGASHEPNVLVTKFGDGYESRAGDGINTDLVKWDNLLFTAATSDILAIEALLAGYGAETAFTWTPDGESEITVVCRSWRRVRTNYGVQAIAASFEEVLG